MPVKTKTVTRYRCTYMGVVTGSYAGRDDGQPEEQTVEESSLEKLLPYLEEENPKFYEVKLTRLDDSKGILGARKQKNAVKAAKAKLSASELAAIKAS